MYITPIVLLRSVLFSVSSFILYAGNSRAHTSYDKVHLLTQKVISTLFFLQITHYNLE